MQKIFVFLTIFFLCVLQVGLVKHLTVFGVAPNILLAFILAYVVSKEGNSVIVWALLAGVMLDVFSSQPFGFYAAGFSIVAWLAQFAGKSIFKTTDLSGQAFMIVCGAFGFGILTLLLGRFFVWSGLASNVPAIGWNLEIILVETVLSAVLGVVVLLIMKKTHGLFARF